MKALVYNTTESRDDLVIGQCRVLESNNIPLFPEYAVYDNGKKTAQIIPFVAPGKVLSLINRLRNDYKTFCDLFAAGKKTMHENIAYTLQLERELQENQIPFDLFVRATI